MKGIIALTLAVIWATGEAKKDKTCPKEDPKDRTVLLPYPGDCTKFYKCNHGKPLPWDCPAGTHFNEKLSVCDWPHKAGCEGAPGEGVSPICSRDKPGTFMYPHPEDCTKFYMCSNGLAFLKDCPPGTHFNEKLSVCDWPHKANCKQGATSPPPTVKPPPPTEATPPPTEAPPPPTEAPPPPTEAPPPPTEAPPPPTEAPPPPTEAPPPPTEAPPPPTEAPPTEKPPTEAPPTKEPPTEAPPTEEPPTEEPQTEEPPTEEPPTEEPPTEEPPTEEPQTEEPQTEEPQTEEPPTEEPPTEEPPTETPPTEAPPTEALPTEEPPTEAPPTEAPPTEAPPTEAPPPPTVTHSPPPANVGWKCPCKPPANEPWKYKYPFPGNCTKYYFCSNHRTYLKHCPGGLYFNAKQSVCDLPENSGCVQEPPAPPPGPDPEWKCPCKPPAEEPWRYMYPYPGDCTKFYMCSNGVAFVKLCPGGTYFNNELSVCDWPDNSGCVQQRSLRSTSTAGWQCPPPSPEKPWRFMYANPADCSKYYLCSRGVAFTRACPRGTGFNEELQACGLPKYAGCSRTSSTAVPAPHWPCRSRKRHFYPVPEDLNKFYICSRGKAFLRSCPRGLRFNDAHTACDRPENVKDRRPVSG